VPARGEWPPFCHEEAEQLSRSVSPGTGKRYGLQRVCRVFGLARSSAYYLKAQAAVPPEQRPAPKKRGPIGAASDGDLVGHIRQALADSPFTGEGYRKVWARLRQKGVRTAAERVRRLMRGHHLQAPRRGGNAHGPKAHDGTITTEKPDEMWGTDMTTTVTTGEGLAHVFVAVDHCTCECVGLHAAKRGDRFEALEPLRQGVREHFGQFGAGSAGGLTVRHDHGSNYLSHHFQRELRFLGITSSPSFVREPEGNGCAERFIRTLKEQLLWVRSFATVAELVEALRQFKATYNERWLIGRHGHRSPSQVRRDLVSGRAVAT
jgi:transposase InsO family protein